MNRIINRLSVITALNYFTRIIGGPVTIILLPYFVNDIQLSFWFTFTSLVSLISLFDLGFSTLAVQIISDEFSKNEINGKRILFKTNSEQFFYGSLYIIFIHTLKIFILSFILVFSIGFTIFYLRSFTQFSVWFIPWLLFSFASSFNLFITILLSVFEGMRQLFFAQLIKLINNFVHYITLFLFLSLKLLLLGIVFSYVITTMLVLILTIFFYHKFLSFKKIVAYKNTNTSKKILFSNLLPRYSLSWFSGFVIFNSFSILAFLFFDSSFTSSFGITFTLFSSVSSFSLFWVHLSVPHMVRLRKYSKFYGMSLQFKKNLVLSLFTYGAGTLAAIIFIFLYSYFFSYRFSSWLVILFLIIGWFFQIIVSNYATYLRSFLEELLTIPSLITAIIIFLITLLVAYLGSNEFFTLGFFIGSFLLFILSRKLVLVKMKSQKESNNLK